MKHHQAFALASFAPGRRLAGPVPVPAGPSTARLRGRQPRVKRVCWSAELEREVGEDFLSEVLVGTRLAGKPLKRVYSAREEGFTCDAFHAGVDLTGVPTLLLGKTAPDTGDSPVLFGAFNPMGWQSLDDYQDSWTPFLFRVPSNPSETVEQLISRKIGGPGAALFDFSDWAVRFGPDSLSIPMNSKKGMKPDIAVSNLGTYYDVFQDGSSSVFGSCNQVKLLELEAFVCEGFDDPPPRPKSVVDIFGEIATDMKKFPFGRKS